MQKLFLLPLMLLVATLANADTLDKLARKYKKYDGVVYAASIDEVEKLNDQYGAKVVVKNDGKEHDGIEELIAKMRESGVKDMRMLQLKECSTEVRTRFAEDVQEAVPRGYESFMRLGDDEQFFSIYLNKRKGSMKVLILYAKDDNSGFVEIDSDNKMLNSLFNF